MPITQADLQPFINGSNSLPSYGNPNIPTSGGNWSTHYNQNGALSGAEYGAILGPIGAGAGAAVGSIYDFASGNARTPDPLLNMLLGGSSGWSPYQQNGQYYWQNPNHSNPVPVASVPGADLKPGRTYRDFANQAQALQTILPYITQSINNQQLPTELNNLRTAQITSPGYAQLMTDLYNQYGPQLNAIGNEITRRNALSQANTSNEVLNGPGRDLVNNAYQLAQVFDKPYYDTRQLGADNISKLMNSIDLSGKLSGSEMNQIGQGLARQNQQSGTTNAPSAINTAANAMQYGQAGYQRQQAAKSNLSDAISKASAFLPTAKSGTDVFQVATGRPSQPNPGNSLFPGINQSSQSNYGLAGSLLGGLNQDNMNNNNIVSQQKDWLDKFVQLTQGISNVASSVGSIAGAAGGMCWIAREVYGESNPKWKQFRVWLCKNSPAWFYKAYLKYGPEIATIIKPFPLIKSIIRKWMDTKICHAK